MHHASKYFLLRSQLIRWQIHPDQLPAGNWYPMGAMSACMRRLLLFQAQVRVSQSYVAAKCVVVGGRYAHQCVRMRSVKKRLVRTSWIHEMVLEGSP